MRGALDADLKNYIDVDLNGKYLDIGSRVLVHGLDSNSKGVMHQKIN